MSIEKTPSLYDIAAKMIQPAEEEPKTKSGESLYDVANKVIERGDLEEVAPSIEISTGPAPIDPPSTEVSLETDPRYTADPAYLKEFVPQGGFTNWKNTLMNAIDELDVKRDEGQIIDAEKQILDLEEQLKPFQEKALVSELNEEELDQAEELQAEIKELQENIAEWDQRIGENKADIEESYVDKEYKYRKQLAMEEEKTAFMNYLTTELPEDLGGGMMDVALQYGAPLTAMGLSKAVRYAGKTLSKTRLNPWVGAGILATDAAGFMGTLGSLYIMRENEMYAELGDAYKNKLQKITAEFIAENGEDALTEETGKALQKEAMQGMEDFKQKQMNLFIGDALQTIALVTPWLPKVRPFGVGIKGRLGTVGTSALYNVIEEGREEGDQYQITQDFIEGKLNNVDKSFLNLGWNTDSWKGSLKYGLKSLEGMKSMFLGGGMDPALDNKDFRNSVRAGMIMALAMGSPFQAFNISRDLINYRAAKGDTEGFINEILKAEKEGMRIQFYDDQFKKNRKDFVQETLEGLRDSKIEGLTNERIDKEIKKLNRAQDVWSVVQKKYNVGEDTEDRKKIAFAGAMYAENEANRAALNRDLQDALISSLYESESIKGKDALWQEANLLKNSIEAFEGIIQDAKKGKPSKAAKEYVGRLQKALPKLKNRYNEITKDYSFDPYYMQPVTDTSIDEATLNSPIDEKIKEVVGVKSLSEFVLSKNLEVFDALINKKSRKKANELIDLIKQEGIKAINTYIEVSLEDGANIEDIEEAVDIATDNNPPTEAAATVEKEKQKVKEEDNKKDVSAGLAPDEAIAKINNYLTNYEASLGKADYPDEILSQKRSMDSIKKMIEEAGYVPEELEGSIDAIIDNFNQFLAQENVESPIEEVRRDNTAAEQQKEAITPEETPEVVADQTEDIANSSEAIEQVSTAAPENMAAKKTFRDGNRLVTVELPLYDENGMLIKLAGLKRGGFGVIGPVTEDKVPKGWSKYKVYYKVPAKNENGSLKRNSYGDIVYTTELKAFDADITGKYNKKTKYYAVADNAEYLEEYYDFETLNSTDKNVLPGAEVELVLEKDWPLFTVHEGTPKDVIPLHVYALDENGKRVGKPITRIAPGAESAEAKALREYMSSKGLSSTKAIITAKNNGYVINIKRKVGLTDIDSAAPKVESVERAINEVFNFSNKEVVLGYGQGGKVIFAGKKEYENLESQDVTDGAVYARVQAPSGNYVPVRLQTSTLSEESVNRVIEILQSEESPATKREIIDQITNIATSYENISPNSPYGLWMDAFVLGFYVYKGDTKYELRIEFESIGQEGTPQEFRAEPLKIALSGNDNRKFSYRKIDDKRETSSYLKDMSSSEFISLLKEALSGSVYNVQKERLLNPLAEVEIGGTLYTSYYQYLNNNMIVTTDLPSKGSQKFVGAKLTLQYTQKEEGKQTVKETVKETVRDNVGVQLGMFGPTNKKEKELATQVFSAYPSLAAIGTEEQYLKYIKTIFPSSKIKDIFHHWSVGPQISDKFGDDLGRAQGIWVSQDPTHWKELITNKSKRLKEQEIKQHWLIVNSLNPYVTIGMTEWPEGVDMLLSYEEMKPSYSGPVLPSFETIDDFEAVIKAKSQIHELGTEKDIENFKSFVIGKTKQPQTQTKEAPKSITDILNKNLNKLRRVYMLPEEVVTPEEILWFKDTYGEENLRVLKNLKSVYVQGEEAWGFYKDGIATIAELGARGTAYHEAWHRFMDLHLTPDERYDLTLEAQKMYGLSDDIALEDALGGGTQWGNGFMEWAINRETEGLTDKVIRFFEDVWFLIKEFLGRTTAIERAFRNAYQGRKITRSMLAHTPDVDFKLRTIPTFTLDDVEEITNVINYDVVTSAIKHYGQNNIKEIIEDPVKLEAIYDRVRTVYKELAEELRESNVEGGYTEADKYEKITLDEYWNNRIDAFGNVNKGFYERSLDALERHGYNVVVEREVKEELHEINFYLRPIKDGLSDIVKRGLSTIESGETSNYFQGRSVFVPFDDMYNYLSFHLANQPNIDARLEYLSTINTDLGQGVLARVYDMFKNSTQQFKQSFRAHFRKQHIKFITILITPKGDTRLIETNRKGLNRQIVANWNEKKYESSLFEKGEVENLINTDILENEVKPLFNSLKEAKKEIKDDVITEEYIKKVNKFLGYLGIELEDASLEVIQKNRTLSELNNLLFGTKESFEYVISVLEDGEDPYFSPEAAIKNLAEMIIETRTDLYTSTFTSGDKKMIYAINYYDFLSQKFLAFKNPETLQKEIDKFYADPLYKPIRDTEGEVNNIHNDLLLELLQNDEEAREKFSWHTLDVLKTPEEKDGKGYRDMDPKATALSRLSMFFNSNNAYGYINTGTKGDKGRAIYLQLPKIRPGSPLWKTAKTTFSIPNLKEATKKLLKTFIAQEHARILATERELFGTKDADNNYIVNPLPDNELVENKHYHPKKDVNKDGSFKEGFRSRRNGNGFKFLQIPALNDPALGLFDKSGKLITPTSGVYSFEELLANKKGVDSAIDAYIEERLYAGKQTLAKQGLIKEMENGIFIDVALPKSFTTGRVTPYKEENEDGKLVEVGKNVNGVIGEFLLNDLILRKMAQKFLYFDLAFYKNTSNTWAPDITIDASKRGYQSITPGNVHNTIPTHMEGYGKPKFIRAGIFRDIFKENEYEYLASLAEYMVPSLKGKALKALKSENLKGFTPKEQEAITIAASYLSANATDGWAVTTMESHIKSLEGRGEWNTTNTKDYPLNPLKTFMFGERLVETSQGSSFIIAEQVKHSTMPLHPELTKMYPELDALRKRMELKGEFAPGAEFNPDGLLAPLDVVNFESAVKVGAYGKVNYTELADIKVRDLLAANERTPQAEPIKAHETKVVSQADKLILANIKNDGTYNIRGEEYSGKDIKSLYNFMYYEKIKRSHDKLKKELKLNLFDEAYEAFEKGNKDVAGKKQLEFLQNLRDILQKENASRGLPDNFDIATELQQVNTALKTYDFKMPLSFPAFVQRFEPTLLSLWKNSVIKQKMHGGHAIQLADYGGPARVDESLSYYTVKEGEVIAAEADIPHEMAVQMGLLEEDVDVIEDIARRFIAFRIPNQGKNSMVLFQVRNILPPGSGRSMMIPAELAVQMGIDYDFDKVYYQIPYNTIKTSKETADRILTAKDLVEEKLTNKDIENWLFEIKWSILHNPENFMEMMNPLDSKTYAKKIEEYEKLGIGVNAPSNDVAAYENDVYFEALHKDAKTGVAISSTHATSHAVSQDAGVALKNEFPIRIDQLSYKLNRIEGNDGKLISSYLAEHQNGFLDNAKDPVTGPLNMTVFTSGVAFILNRAGINNDVMFDFINQPIIRALGIEYGLADIKNIDTVAEDLAKKLDLSLYYNEDFPSGIIITAPKLKKGLTTSLAPEAANETYSGLVKSLKENEIFVFGSNPLGINGNPAKYPNMSASVATANKWVEQGEIMDNRLSESGKAYGLTTVTAPGKKKSLSKKQIIANIKELYKTAKITPTKKYLIAYTDTGDRINNNGYTSKEMAEMFTAAGVIPSNIVFNKEFNALLPSTANNLKFQGYVLREFVDYYKSGMDLQKVNSVFSPDTAVNMSSLAYIEVWKNKLRHLKSANSRISIPDIYNQVTDIESPTSRFDAYLKFGINAAEEFANKFIPYNSQAYYNLKQDIAFDTGQKDNLLNKDLTDAINRATFSYILTQEGSHLQKIYEDTEMLKEMLFGRKTSVAANYVAIKDKYNLGQDKLFKYIVANEKNAQNLLQELQFNNTATISKDTKNMMTDRWEEWLGPEAFTLLPALNTTLDADEISEGVAEIQGLLHNLAIYSVVTSGFQSGPSSFISLIPLHVWSLWRLSGFYRQEEEKIQSNPNYFKGAEELIIQNLVEVQGLVKSVKSTEVTVGKEGTDFPGAVRKDGSIAWFKVHSKKFPNLFIPTSFGMLPRPVTYVKMYDSKLDRFRLYRLVKDNVHEATYKEIPVFGQLYRFMEINAQGIEESIHPSNRYEIPELLPTDRVYDKNANDSENAIIQKEEKEIIAEAQKEEKKVIVEGVEVNRVRPLTKDEQMQIFDILKPVIEEQAAKTNKGKKANMMIGLGMRWDYKVNNKGKTPVAIENIINPGSKAKYGYYTESAYGQPLVAIPDEIRRLISESTGIDASNYDSAIVNIYDSETFISTHQDVDEAADAVNYPVLVLNIGGEGNVVIERMGVDPVALEAGDSYTIGIDGKNREAWHRTLPSPIEGFLPEIKMPNGQVYPEGSYRISITLRRAQSINVTSPVLPEYPGDVTKGPNEITGQYSMFQLDKEMEEIRNLETVLGIRKKGILTRYFRTDYEKALKKAQVINKRLREMNSPFKAAITSIPGEKGDTRIYYAVHLRSTMKQIDSKKEIQERDEKLESFLLDLLAPFGVTKEEVDSWNIEGHRGMSTIAKKADFVQLMVQIARDKASLDTLPEEAVHISTSLLGVDNPIIKRAMELAKGTDKHLEVIRDYWDIYDGNEFLLLKETMDQLLTDVLIKKWQEKESSASLKKTLMRLWEKIKQWWRRINGNLVKAKLEDLYGDIAEDILSGEAADKMSVDNIAKNIKMASAAREGKKYTLDEVLEEAESIRLSEDASVYILDGVDLTRATSFTGSFKDPFNAESRATWMVDRKIRKKLIDPQNRTKEIQKLLQRWDFMRDDHGTGLHKVAELVLEPIINDNSTERIVEILKEQKELLEAKEERSQQEEMEFIFLEEALINEEKKKATIKFIEQYRGFINEIKNREGFKRFVSEVRVGDTTLQLAGTIDLIEEYVDQEDGRTKYRFYDFKTKEKGKVGEFPGYLREIWDPIREKDKQVGFGANVVKVKKLLQDQFGKERINLIEDYSLQQSLYRYMFERKGLEVTAASIIPIESTIGDQGKPTKMNPQGFTFSEPTLREPIKVPYVKLTIEKMLQDPSNANYRAMREMLEVEQLKAPENISKDEVFELNKAYKKFVAARDAIQKKIQQTQTKLLALRGKRTDVSSRDIKEEDKAYREEIQFLENQQKELGKLLHDPKAGLLAYVKIAYDSIMRAKDEYNRMSKAEKVDLAAVLAVVRELSSFDLLDSIKPELEAKDQKMVENLLAIRNEILNVGENNDEGYMDLVIRPLADKLFEYSTDLSLTRDDIIRLLRRAQNDIGFFNRFIDPLWEAPDRILQLAAALVQDTKMQSLAESNVFMYGKKEGLKKLPSEENTTDDSAYNLRKKGLHKIEENLNKLAEKEGIDTSDYRALYDFMLETNDKNELTGRYVSKDNWKYLDAYNAMKGILDIEQKGKEGEDLKLKKIKSIEKDYGVKYSAAFKTFVLTTKESTFENRRKLTNLFNEDWKDHRYKDNKKWNDLVKWTKKGKNARAEFYSFYVNAYRTASYRIPAYFRRQLSLIPIRKDSTDRLWKGSIRKTIGEFLEDVFVINEAEIDRGQLIGEIKDVGYVPLHYITSIGNEEAQLNVDNVSLDLVSSLKRFNEMSLNYQNMTNILPTLELTKEALRHRKIVQRSGGIPIINKWVKFGNAEKTVLGGDAFERFVDYMNTDVYGKRKTTGTIFTVRGRRIDTSKIADAFKMLVGQRGLGFNWYSAIQNPIVGFVNNMIEVGGGKLTDKNLWKAVGIYADPINMKNMFQDAMAKRPTSKIGILVERWDLLQQWDEYGEPVRKTGLKKRLTSPSSSMIGMEMGEHFVQLSLFIGMALTKKFITSTGERSLWDAITVDKDGEINLDKEVAKQFTQKDLNIFLNDFYGTSQRAHGHYAKKDGPALRMYWQFRWAEQFRRWMRPGFKKRWAGIGDAISGKEGVYSERLQTMDEGMYSSVAIYLRKILYDVESIKLSLAVEEWDKMPLYRKQNINRTLRELMLTLFTWVLTLIIPADTDDDDEWLVYTGLYHLYRLRSELMFYWNINETLKLAKSPAASVSLIEAVIKLLMQITPPNTMEEYQRDYGNYKKGDLKALARLERVLPWIYQIRRISTPKEEVDWFKK